MSNYIELAWLDPDNNYQLTIEVVEDKKDIFKFGKSIQLVKAYHCTTRDQVLKCGNHMLHLNRKERGDFNWISQLYSNMKEINDDSDRGDAT